ncbi:hypothetical protein BESB_001980 [Besnoitia besnoiti]|uniref:Uncharacterized protein n=1 Tax=Besnoitia besnoiti TaxID=94643 RepID=A0A2A9MPB3_BESBE|nr:hypothetical protein BESB_001980 [Besnoitia besnoiti]PFH37857.1 hypothetical protein BESB_001980 [Besnoitia besnoiti]
MAEASRYGADIAAGPERSRLRRDVKRRWTCPAGGRFGVFFSSLGSRLFFVSLVLGNVFPSSGWSDVVVAAKDAQPVSQVLPVITPAEEDGGSPTESTGAAGSRLEDFAVPAVAGSPKPHPAPAPSSPPSSALSAAEVAPLARVSPSFVPPVFAAWRADGFAFDRTSTRIFLFPQAERFAVPLLSLVSREGGDERLEGARGGGAAPGEKTAQEALTVPSSSSSLRSSSPAGQGASGLEARSQSLRKEGVAQREQNSGVGRASETPSVRSPSRTNGGAASGRREDARLTRAVVTYFPATGKDEIETLERLYGLVESWRFTFGVLERPNVEGDALHNGFLSSSPSVEQSSGGSGETEPALRLPPAGVPLINDLIIFADPRLQSSKLPPVCEQLRPWEGHLLASLRLQSRLETVSLLRSLRLPSPSSSPVASSPELSAAPASPGVQPSPRVSPAASLAFLSLFSRKRLRRLAARVSGSNWRLHPSRCFVIFTFVNGVRTPDSRWEKRHIQDAVEAELAYLAEPIIATVLDAYEEVLKIPLTAFVTPSLLVRRERRTAQPAAEARQGGRRAGVLGASGEERRRDAESERDEYTEGESGRKGGRGGEEALWLVVQESKSCSSETSKIAVAEYARLFGLQHRGQVLIGDVWLGPSRVVARLSRLAFLIANFLLLHDSVLARSEGRAPDWSLDCLPSYALQIALGHLVAPDMLVVHPQLALDLSSSSAEALDASPYAAETWVLTESEKRTGARAKLQDEAARKREANNSDSVLLRLYRDVELFAPLSDPSSSRSEEADGGREGESTGGVKTLRDFAKACAAHGKQRLRQRLRAILYPLREPPVLRAGDEVLNAVPPATSSLGALGGERSRDFPIFPTAYIRTELREFFRCPAEHPYPFTHPDFADHCCKTQRDCHGNALTSLSSCCYNDEQTQCRAPPCDPGAEDARMDSPPPMPPHECPPSFPYPYSAVETLAFCCATDKDCWGELLHPGSSCCENHDYMQCPDPPCAPHRNVLSALGAEARYSLSPERAARQNAALSKIGMSRAKAVKTYVEVLQKLCVIDDYMNDAFREDEADSSGIGVDEDDHGTDRGDGRRR